MKTVTLVTVVTGGDPAATELFGFSDALVGSSWWSQLASEYGFAATSQSYHVTGPALASSPSFTQIQDYLQQSGTSAGHPPNGQTLYVLYLPPGMQLTLGDADGDGNDSDENGYHDACCSGLSYPGDAFAVASGVIQDGALESISSESLTQQRTRTASHEIAEALTDPATDPETGYVISVPAGEHTWASVFALAGGGELADLCRIGNRVVLPGGESYLAQRIWSNTAAAAGGDPCIPASSDPYYSTSIPQAWYPAAPGATVSIPVQGWSTAPMGDWTIERNVQAYGCAGTPCAAPVDGEWSNLSLVSSLAMESPGGVACTPAAGMRSGATATLQVDVSATAVSGDYIVLGVLSARQFAGCDTPVTSDLYHLWPVGVYVP
jgi:hypothetical protein